MNKIALGTAQFGLDYGINNLSGKIAENISHQILRYAYDRKIDYIDTAYVYGDSEQVLGSFIKKNKINFKIISKFSCCSIDNFEKSFIESLHRLNSKQLYGYLVHDFKFFIKNPLLWTKFLKIKNDLLVSKIGFSLYFEEELDYLLDSGIEFDIIQVPYSIFDQRFAKYFRILKSKGIEIFVRSVFLQGLVFKSFENLEPKFSKFKCKLKALNKLAEELNLSISSICLNFAVLNDYIDKVVIGFDNLDHFKQDLFNLKQINEIKKIENNLLYFKEDDNNIIIPINW
ncbi:aldo/keto reductase [Candidatus Dependentiae bacterium]|nr:aldo/keto reductase [Candidatus Dependentiae bacterium]